MTSPSRSLRYLEYQNTLIGNTWSGIDTKATVVFSVCVALTAAITVSSGDAVSAFNKILIGMFAIIPIALSIKVLYIRTIRIGPRISPDTEKSLLTPEQEEAMLWDTVTRLSQDVMKNTKYLRRKERWIRLAYIMAMPYMAISVLIGIAGTPVPV